MEEDKILKTVVDSLEYEMLVDVLVKPLPVDMITKEVLEPRPTGKKVKDELGLEVEELGEPEKVIKEVESNFRKGIVLALPSTWNDDRIKIGDTVIFPKNQAIYFDLYKDSMLVKGYTLISKKIK